MNFSSFSEMKFHFHFAAGIAVKASIFAIAMGLLGGMLPAVRAARLPHRGVDQGWPVAVVAFRATIA
jgi:hypothetical protein